MFADISKNLAYFIENSPTPFHCVANICKILDSNGFKQREECDNSEIQSGQKYYTVRNGSSIIAYKTPAQTPNGVKIVASHSDSPCFKLKPNAEIKGEYYTRINIERYGSMIYSTWMDRMLKIAGRVSYAKDDRAESKNVILDGYAIIPNAAIHLNRKLNDGYVYNPKSDLIPVLSGDKTTSLTKRISECAKIPETDILDYDLYLYNPDKPVLWGENEEFISAPRIDNLQCVYSTLCGFLPENNSENIQIYALFDNEEVGSTTSQGADSTFLSDVLEDICDSYIIKMRKLLPKSFIISADNAHACHPNMPELSDSSNAPQINSGVVIKYNANQKYITDSVSAAKFKLICKRAGEKYQSYANRSDLAGGSTLGNISNTQVSISGVDIGIAQLAMHSAFETSGSRDSASLANIIKNYFSFD